MAKKHMIVSDIDGTLLRDGQTTDGLKTLKSVLKMYKGEVTLAYATGRSFKSTWQLIEKNILPMPNAIAPLVGTEIWFPTWERKDSDYQKMICKDWDRDVVIHQASKIPGLVLQEDEFQSPMKASYYLTDSIKIFDIEKLLTTDTLKSRVIYSCGKYLDIIPALAGKSAAVKHLQAKWSIDSNRVLTCGDSGNDLDMLLDPQTFGVAVGNSEKEVLLQANTGSFYSAFLPFASGVLEGAAAFNFWPKRKPSTTTLAVDTFTP